MTGRELLMNLQELTSSQLDLPVRVETEIRITDDCGSDVFYDIDEPILSCNWNSKSIILKAK